MSDSIYSSVFKNGNNIGLGLSKDNTFRLATENPVGNIDTSKYLNTYEIDSGKDGLGDGMLSSIFGKDGYLGSVNKDLEGIGGFEGLGKGIGLGLNVMGIMNQRKGAKLAKQAWEAENARANEIMAMNREKYDTFKKDKAALNASYSGAK